MQNAELRTRTTRLRPCWVKFAEPGRAPIKNVKELRAALEANPSLASDVIQQARQGAERELGSGSNYTSIHTFKDLLNEAGFANHGIGREILPPAWEPTLARPDDPIRTKGVFVEEPSTVDVLKKLLGMKGGRSGYSASLGSKASLGSWMEKQKGISGLAAEQVGKLTNVPDGLKGLKIPGATATMDIEQAPELYRRLLRPSIKGRVPIPVQLGLLGAGVIGANEIQKRVMGN